MAISQLRLNLEKGCFRSYGLIDSAGSVKLPSDNYFLQIQDGDIQDCGNQNGVLFISCTQATLCPHRNNSRFTTRYPVRIQCPGDRRLPSVYGLATMRLVHR